MLDGEQKLVERAIKGEPSAFGLLYDHYQPQIYRFIFLKTSRKEEAEDLAHRVFLKAWQSIAKYQPTKVPFSGWLYRIAKNQVIDFYRTRKTIVEIDETIEVKTEFSLEGDLEKTMDLERIKTAIKKLDPEQQDVLILRFVEDLSPEEVAEILNKRTGAVKVIQHRAIENLKKWMTN